MMSSLAEIAAPSPQQLMLRGGIAIPQILSRRDDPDLSAYLRPSEISTLIGYGLAVRSGQHLDGRRQAIAPGVHRGVSALGGLFPAASGWITESLNQ